MTLAARTLIACRSRGWRLAVAESCTGGLITANLTDVPGSSDVLDRGYVTYSNLAKTQMLGVSPETLEAFGAVSPEVAGQMAQGALAQANVEIAVAVTGIAGPGGSEFKPEGMVCLGLAQQGLDTETKTLAFGPLGRSVVRARSVEAALEWVLNAAEPT